MVETVLCQLKLVLFLHASFLPFVNWTISCQHGDRNSFISSDLISKFSIYGTDE